jgi:hypothetical protein
MGAQVRYHVQPFKDRWGVVRHINDDGELEVEMLDAGIVLREADDDFVLSAWLRRYDADHDIIVGDTIMFAVMPSHQLVARDVVTKREVTKGARTHSRNANDIQDSEHPDQDIPTGHGNILYFLDVHDEEAKKLGVIPVYDETSMHDGWDTRWNHGPDGGPYVPFPSNDPYTRFGATVGQIVTGYQVRDPHTDELIGYVPIYSGDEAGPDWMR